MAPLAVTPPRTALPSVAVARGGAWGEALRGGAGLQLSDPFWRRGFPVCLRPSGLVRCGQEAFLGPARAPACLRGPSPGVGQGLKGTLGNDSQLVRARPFALAPEPHAALVPGTWRVPPLDSSPVTVSFHPGRKLGP